MTDGCNIESLIDWRKIRVLFLKKAVNAPENTIQTSFISVFDLPLAGVDTPTCTMCTVGAQSSGDSLETETMKSSIRWIRLVTTNIELFTNY